MSERKLFDNQPDDIAWCPGCGDFPIRNALIGALNELNLKETEVVMCSGIGQAAKMPQYIKSHMWNGLHGRGLPPATAIKAVNPGLTVIAEGGDGDMYGEGGNHLLHAIRRNPDITLFVHDNMVYGLTKGQASPTSQRGMVTPVQPAGVIAEPLNPLALAIATGATFVARGFSGNSEQLQNLMKRAIRHKGFALLDIFQPCVSFNKLNGFQWFSRNTYILDASYDPHDKLAAFAKTQEAMPYPLGVIYEEEGRSVFEESIPAYASDKTPLALRKPDMDKLRELIRRKAE
jgi:2-oxoglutarate ferredoxin oxidoreductase subunit beta